MNTSKWWHLLHEYLLEIGVGEAYASLVNTIVLGILSMVLVYIFDFVLWKILRYFTTRFARRSRTNFDDIAITHRLPRYIAHILPLILAFDLLPIVFFDYPYLETIGVKILKITSVFLILQISQSLLRTIRDYLKTLPRFKDKPINSYIQVFMIFAWAAGILTIIALLTGTEIWKFLTGLGAASAVLLLIFKDTILGFVASIQVSLNDMVRIGDWITFEKYGADGDVIEINLATVKVQNFDKTITTIPTYALISDSFKNWRGMQASGGRRIKRAIIIKQNSIRFLTNGEVNKLKKIQLITNYLNDRQKKIEASNEAKGIDKSMAINGRNLTNLGVFRKYIESYLENHSAINQKMTLMTRQLAPTPQGIPLEIYAFSSDKRWENYEYIMADIFDHILAATPYFYLEIFELPSQFKIEA